VTQWRVRVNNVETETLQCFPFSLLTYASRCQ